MSRTFTARFGRSHTQTVTVSVVPGAVMESPSNTMTGGGYGRKTPSADPEKLAREMADGFLADGWTEV